MLFSHPFFHLVGNIDRQALNLLLFGAGMAGSQQRAFAGGAFKDLHLVLLGQEFLCRNVIDKDIHHHRAFGGEQHRHAGRCQHETLQRNRHIILLRALIAAQAGFQRVLHRRIPFAVFRIAGQRPLQRFFGVDMRYPCLKSAKVLGRFVQPGFTAGREQGQRGQNGKKADHGAPQGNSTPPR
ncbi:hypothetical protein [Leisingera sp. F5]|uniref:hypothetical protein n=1 Tax=Leisingera sp. F5 TaxID=1813816 RepID=UPI00345BB7EB